MTEMTELATAWLVGAGAGLGGMYIVAGLQLSEGMAALATLLSWIFRTPSRPAEKFESLADVQLHLSTTGHPWLGSMIGCSWCLGFYAVLGCVIACSWASGLRGGLWLPAAGLALGTAAVARRWVEKGSEE